MKDKKFDKLYEKHQQEWDDMTTNAYNAARDHICGGNVPRPDDVLKMLLPMLEPHETLSIVGSSVQSIATEGELIRRAVETRRLGNRFEQL